MRRAAVLSSVSLLRGMERAAAAGAEPDVRTRKAESKILRYALRASTKTSPWSWFTAVGWGRWDRDSDGVLWSDPRSISVPNHALVVEFIRALRHLPEHRHRTPHRLAPALTVDQRHVAFRRDEVMGVRQFVLTREQQVRLPRTAALDRVLSELRGAGPAGRTLGQLADALAALLPAGQSRHAAASAYVERLAAEQLLVAIAPIDPHAVDPLPALAAWAATNGESSLAAGLTAIGQASREFAALPAAARPAALRRLDEDWDRAFARTGAAKPTTPVVREDVVFDRPLRLGRAAGRDIRDDLARLAPLTELFDNAAVLRGLLRRQMVDRYGPGGRCRLVDAVADGVQLWAAAGSVAADGTIAPPPDAYAPLPPDLLDLAALRREVTAAARATTRRGDEVELPEKLVADVSDALPAWLLRRPSSHAYFVQPLHTQAGTGWCVNSIGDGWGRYTSRFLDLLGPGLARAVTGQLDATFAGSRVAQYRPLSGFNANLHPRLVADEVGEDPAWANLLTDQLELVHDPQADVVRLRVAGTGQHLDVLYLGFLLQPALPDRVAPLYLDLGASRVYLGHLAPAEPVEVAGHAVWRHCRLRYRAVVAARRSWVLEAATAAEMCADLQRDDDVPVSAAARWAARLGLPPAIFVSGATTDLFRDPDALRTHFTNPKPQFVDLGSALHLRCLARLLSGYSGPIRIAEALPVPGAGPAGRRAVELVVETYRRRR